MDTPDLTQYLVIVGLGSSLQHISSCSGNRLPSNLQKFNTALEMKLEENLASWVMKEFGEAHPYQNKCEAKISLAIFCKQDKV